MRMIARFAKGEDLKFCSHLDTQRIFIRALSRAQIPVEFSQGFNKHPKLSMALALPVGEASQSEYIDFALAQAVEEGDFVHRMNAALPEGIRILQAKLVEGGKKSLTALVYAADYRICLKKKTDLRQKIVEILGRSDIIIEKKTKSGTAPTDVRGMILDLKQNEEGELLARLRCGEVNLKPRDLMALLTQEQAYSVTRMAVYANREGECGDLFSFL